MTISAVGWVTPSAPIEIIAEWFSDFGPFCNVLPRTSKPPPLGISIEKLAVPSGPSSMVQPITSVRRARDLMWWPCLVPVKRLFTTRNKSTEPK